VRLLLDTHAWLWRLLEPERLSPPAEAAIVHRNAELFLSPISTWETLVLARKGKLALTPSPHEWILAALRRSAPTAAPLNHEAAMRSEALDGFASQDPADRFLVATAIELNLTLVTADTAMHAFEQVQTLW